MPGPALSVRPLAAVAAVAAVAAGLGAYFGITAARGGPASGSGSAVPSPRTGAAAAYDPAHGDVVLFGGLDDTVAPARARGDTWTWDGSAWTQLHPAAAPPAAPLNLMAYDPADHDVVLVSFPGPDTAVSPSSPAPPPPSTWTWDGSTWRRAGGAPPAASPASRMATDAATGSVLLVTPAAPVPQPLLPCRSGPEPAEPLPNVCLPPYGGFGVTTWRWDGSAWQKAATSNDSSGFGGQVSSLVTDPASGHAELFTMVPSIVPACAVPLPTGSAAAAPEPCLGVKAGGQVMPDLTPLMSVRLWSGSGWMPPHEVAPPDSGRGQGMVMPDPAGHRVLWVSLLDGSTWAYGGGGWTRLPSSLPQPPSLAAAATDAGGHPLLFGGMVATGTGARGGVSDETWVWDGSTWQRRGGSIVPPAPVQATAVPGVVPPATPVPQPALTPSATPV